MSTRRIFDFESEEFFTHSVELRIMEEQEKAQKSNLNKLICKHISIGKGSCLCSAEELYKALKSSGVDEEHITLSIDDFSERVSVTINEVGFDIYMPTFPKEKMEKDISIHIADHSIVTRVSRKALPGSIVNFLSAVSDWIPQYAAIEENIRIEEEKKRLASTIAFDLIKQITEEKLNEKMYSFDISYNCYRNKADIRVYCGESIELSLNISLTENFLDDLNLLLDSLPHTPASWRDD